MARSRLDRLLVARGAAPDTRTAAAWIMARRVRVGDAYVTKPGAQVRDDADVRVSAPEAFASRGGLKLDRALERFGLDVAGRTALDAGASTGGFTDCLLQRGAARVYAVDAGYGQLRGSLAAHPRVVVLERTNISELAPSRFEPPLDLCVADLSYLSVAKSLPILAALFTRPVAIVHLIKPLFEGVRLEQAATPEPLLECLHRAAAAARACELSAERFILSSERGSRGTVEFFGFFCEPGLGGGRPRSPEDAIAELAAEGSPE